MKKQKVNWGEKGQKLFNKWKLNYEIIKRKIRKIDNKNMGKLMEINEN